MSPAMFSDDALKEAVCGVAADEPGFLHVQSRGEAIGVISKVLPLFPIRAAALCGSFARKEQTAASDIDLLVSFGSQARIGDAEAAREALEYATGRSVDLITTLAGHTTSFRDSIMRDGVKIYG